MRTINIATKVNKISQPMLKQQYLHMKTFRTPRSRMMAINTSVLLFSQKDLFFCRTFFYQGMLKKIYEKIASLRSQFINTEANASRRVGDN